MKTRPLQPLFYTAAGFADTVQHTQLLQLQMFVIKNLDTGLEMRIDDFDRLAHIATDPDPENQVRLATHMQHTQLQAGGARRAHSTNLQACAETL